ncbi:MAG: SpoIIE family protein phosphatase [Defluviitaleaceae bacterium]|nr:SpoIIE family protein phosphatase [Defluviitaleaceae bacterium]
MGQKQSTTKRMTVLVVIGVFALTAMLGIVMYRVIRYHTVNRYFELALGSAQMAAFIVDGNRFEDYLRGEVDDTYFTSESLLQSLVDSYDLRYLYIVMFHPDYDPDYNPKIVYIFNFEPFTEDPDEIGGLGDRIHDDAVQTYYFAAVHETGLATSSPVETNTPRYGHLISAYVPVFANGRVVAIACVDIYMSPIIRAALLQISVLFGVVFLSYAFMIFFYNKGHKKSEQINLERERVMTELGVAKNIQMRMLPSISELTKDKEGFDIHAHIETSRQVRGAFYDAFFAGDNLLVVVIGDVSDVSDKNISAALLMSSAMMLIKNGANMLINNNQQDPHKVFEAVNNALLHDGMRAGASVTAFMGCLDLTNGEFSYVNAGHNRPLLKKGENGYSFADFRLSPSLALEKNENQRYEKEVIYLDEGDVLCLYTDGVIGAKNKSGVEFSSDDLLDVVNGYEGECVKELTKIVRARLSKFVFGAEQVKDTALLALKFNEKGRQNK